MEKWAPVDALASYVHLKKSTVHHGASVAALSWNCEATGRCSNWGWVQAEVVSEPAAGPASKAAQFVPGPEGAQFVPGPI